MTRIDRFLIRFPLAAIVSAFAIGIVLWGAVTISALKVIAQMACKP